MLQPDTRRLLTDALRPPSGFHLDAAVATTYSLDLVSLVLAPLAMAAHDAASTSGDVDPDPIALLESVRRHASRITVFCQAGAVHVPSQYRPVLGFIEDSVIQVVPPQPTRLFHPKIWVLRFEDAAGQARHRFLCLSRNLTMDRSWDTVLQMEQSAQGGGADPAPIADFLLDLPLLTPVLDADRQALVESLATTLRGTRLEVPQPFRTAEFWPMGTSSGREWPFPAEAQRLVAITPFLDAGFVRRMPRATTWSRLVSRAETFDRLGGRAIPPTASTWVLQRAAETDDPDEQAPDTHLEVTSGLHAKTAVWDADGSGHAFTGSANGTSAAFGGNVEFSVLMSGPVSSCGTASLVSDEAAARGEVGLAKLLQPYEISSPDPVPDPTWEAEQALETYHARLAMAGITITAVPEAEHYSVTVALPDVGAPEGSTTTVRLLGRKGHALPIDGELVWHNLTTRNLSPFVVLETTVAIGGPAVRRACVVKGALIGGPTDRQRQILRSMLDSEKDLLRYLALLLGDPAFDAMVAGLHEGLTGEPGKHRRGGDDRVDDLVVFEPLLRAAARLDGSLGRVDSLLTELADPDGRVPHLSPDFLALWSTVWDATKEMQR